MFKAEFIFSSNFNAVFSKMVVFMAYWWIVKKFATISVFYFKKGSKRPKFQNFSYLEGI